MVDTEPVSRFAWVLAFAAFLFACSGEPSSNQASTAASAAAETASSSVTSTAPSSSESETGDETTTAEPASADEALTTPSSEQGQTDSAREPAGDTNSDSADSDPVDSGPVDSDRIDSDPVDAETESTRNETREPIEELLDELIVFVEAERGLEFTSRPTVFQLDNDEFNDAWIELIARDVDDNAVAYRDFTDIYQATGIIDSSDTLEAIWTRFGDAGVLGYYDTDTQQIVLRGGELTTFTETVLVHELVHALEDQVFDLDRDEHDDRDDEIEWVFSAIIEGSARVIEDRYRDTFSQAELDEENRARNAVPRGVSFDEFTTSFLELQFGRYRYGTTFAEALWADGQESLDAALIEPPGISEQILHPELFDSGSTAGTSVIAPVPDGEVFESGVWGQAGFAALLADELGRDAAFAATQGWGSDAYVAWRDGDQTCVRIHVAADDAEALDRYAAALEDWADASDDRSVFFPTADLIRVTSCG